MDLGTFNFISRWPIIAAIYCVLWHFHILEELQSATGSRQRSLHDLPTQTQVPCFTLYSRMDDIESQSIFLMYHNTLINSLLLGIEKLYTLYLFMNGFFKKISSLHYCSEFNSKSNTPISFDGTTIHARSTIFVVM